jgi:hypothetical protein
MQNTKKQLAKIISKNNEQMQCANAKEQMQKSKCKKANVKSANAKCANAISKNNNQR